MDVSQPPGAPGSTSPDAVERAAAMASARLAEVFEQSPSFMAVLSGPEHVFELANDRYRQLVGHRELIGRSVREALPEIAGQGFFELLDQVYATGKPFVGRDVRVTLRLDPRGAEEERHLEFVYQPIRDAGGAVSGIFVQGVDLTERRRAEEQVRRSEELFRAAFDQSVVGMVLADMQGRVQRANGAYCRMVGYAEDELLGRTSLIYTHPEDRGLNIDTIRRLEMSEAGSAVYEKRYVRKDGGTIWAQISISPVHDGGGSTTGLIAVVEDVTESKRRAARDAFLLGLEDAIRSLEDPLEIMRTSARMLAQHVCVDRCAYAEVDEDQDAFDVTADYAVAGVPSMVGRHRMSDFGAEALRRTRAGEAFVVADVEAEPAAAAGPELPTYRRAEIRAVVGVPLMKNGRFVAGMAVHQRSPRRWLAEEVELIRTVANRCWESIERARVTRDLREREREFRQLADAMPQIVFMARADGHVDYFNRRWYEYTGLAEGEVGFESWRHVHTADGLRRAMEVWPEAVRTGRPYEIEYPLRRHDGQFRWHLGRALPIRDEQGRVVRWFGTNTDIHDQRELLSRNEELLASERAARAEAERVSRMKDEFLATLSHELRTPLNAILGWSQILQTMPAAESADVREGLGVIERNARAQTQIIEDLLDMGRIISGKVRLDVRPMELAGVVSAAIDTVRPAANAKGVRIQPVLAVPGQTVSGDPGRLQQVFWNLLSNAVKFTPRDGRVQVRLARVHSHVEVAVTDSGEGIRPDFLPHVFDRFRQADASTTRRHGGLGLGLAIVKQLVELHGGRVSVASGGPGQGATFTVALPLTAAHEPSAATGDAADQNAADRPVPTARSYADPSVPQLRGVKVLVVDDEPDARALLRRLLAECQASVRQAASAAEALEMIRAERPDVLVSDIGMPGEDGYSLIRRVRALGADAGGNLPAVALTAYARAEDRVRAILAGFQAHISKPVEPAELVATVASLAGMMR